MEYSYNIKTRIFSAHPTYPKPGMTKDEFDKAYNQMLEDAIKLAEAEHPDLFSEKSNLVVPTPIAESHYAVYKALVNKDPWVKKFLNDTELINRFNYLASEALKGIEKNTRLLIKDHNPRQAKNYLWDKNLKGSKYLYIDNFNRLIFKTDDRNKNVLIVSIMFHHNKSMKETYYMSKFEQELLLAMASFYHFQIFANNPTKPYTEFINSIK